MARLRKVVCWSDIILTRPSHIDFSACDSLIVFVKGDQAPN